MIPTDITEKLRAARTDPNWGKESFWQLLQALSVAVPNSSVDWDREAGEEWGRVLQGQKVVALLWLRGAFVFLDATYLDQLSATLYRYSLQSEIVEDWDEARFKVGKKALVEFCGRGELSDALDASALSANDLWWATV